MVSKSQYSNTEWNIDDALAPTEFDKTFRKDADYSKIYAISLRYQQLYRHDSDKEKLRMSNLCVEVLKTLLHRGVFEYLDMYQESDMDIILSKDFRRYYYSNMICYIDILVNIYKQKLRGDYSNTESRYLKNLIALTRLKQSILKTLFKINLL